MALKFYVGLHKPQHSDQFERAFISVNVLCERRSDGKGGWFYRRRSKPVPAREWILDSGAFTEVDRNGPNAWNEEALARYAGEVRRLAELHPTSLIAAVAPDIMCEPLMVAKTGLGSVRAHMERTVENYRTLLGMLGGKPPVYILPVIQGYAPEEYVECIRLYGELLPAGAWVGVGSVCKRNSKPESVAAVLRAIHAERPDLRLHGFGVKLTALAHPEVRAHLTTADSMAWSLHARLHGRDGNSPTEAHAFVAKVDALIAA